MLDLSHNYITSVPQALATAPALCHLDLSYNSNNAKQACLTLDAAGLGVLTAMPSLRACALVRCVKQRRLCLGMSAEVDMCCTYIGCHQV